MGYIRVPKVCEKLKKAEDLNLPVAMTAATGWGKSAAVEYYYRRKAVLTIKCRNGTLESKPGINNIRQTVVVIEDMQWLSDENDYNYIRKLLKAGGMQIILITRGAFPKNLSGEEQDYNFVRLTESDFALGADEVKAFFADREVEIHEEDIFRVAEASKGYPRAVYYYTVRMAGGIRYSDQILQLVWEDIYHLWDGMMYEQWTDEFREFALSVCRYEDFTEEMAVFLTGNPRVVEVLEYYRVVMTQIIRKEDGKYSIRPESRGFFCWKQNLSWTQEAILDNYRKGAYFYEIHGDVIRALEYYHKAGAKDSIRELLIKNAQNHPGTGHYIETKAYYFALSEDEIRK